MTDLQAPPLGERLDRAFAMAANLHRDQIRKKTGIPYLAHVMAVSAMVLEYGGDEDEAIAALLHDGPEDCGGQLVLDEIRRQFGDVVAEIVLGCTDTLEPVKPPWRERKEAYIAHLEHASPKVHRVSLADKVHNTGSIVEEYRRIGPEIWQRFRGGRAGSLWYYRSLLGAFDRVSAEGCADLANRLARNVSKLEELVRDREGAAAVGEEPS